MTYLDFMHSNNLALHMYHFGAVAWNNNSGLHHLRFVIPSIWHLSALIVGQINGFGFIFQQKIPAGVFLFDGSNRHYWSNGENIASLLFFLGC